MHHYEAELTTGADGSVRLPDGSLPTGLRVRVVVVGLNAPRPAAAPTASEVTYPLRGKPIWAAPDAFDGPAVAPDEWEAMRDGA